MANPIVALFDGVAKLVKDKVTLRSMKKEDLQKLLRTNIDGHNKIAYVLNLQSDSSWQNWYKNSLQPALNKQTSMAKDVVYTYIRGLSGKAASYERKRFLYSLHKANETFADLLEDISKKIDTLMEEDAITIDQVRLSHLAVLGILRQSNMVMNWTMYLYAYITRVSSHTTSLMPKYRENYLLDNQAKVSNIVSQLCDKRGVYQFMSEVTSARNKQADMVLGAFGFQVPKGNLLTGFSSTFLDQVWNALSYLNIFGAALDAWDDYQIERNQRNKEIKEWLEQHNALLRMDLEEMDPTSPQYQKTLSIIRAYDEKIAEYDQKITKFEES